MTFKELELKKVIELLSPYMDITYRDGWVQGNLNEFTMFTYFGPHNMCVHHFANFLNPSWEYTECKSYFDVLRVLPKVKETYLEVKFPGYHNKLKRIQDDF